MLDLQTIERKVDSIAIKLAAPAAELPTYGYPAGCARPFIEVDDHGYHYVVQERGEEYERMTTSDIDILLYRIFNTITFTLASDYELTHRIESQDNRRIIFKKWAELMGSISPDWKRLCEEEINSILSEHPYTR